jgi:hypothetical protein
LRGEISVLSFRASLAFVLFAALAASPVSSASVRHHSARGHSATHQFLSHNTQRPRGEAQIHASAQSDDTTTTTHGSRVATKGGRKAKAKVVRSHGQQAIDPNRVTEIQQALIREHYLTGEASGSWDDATKDAMQKYQADQGWQTKLMPDSRALKKLGLGPDYSSAINAKNSSFAEPPPAAAQLPPEQAAGFAAAAGVNP